MELDKLIMGIGQKSDAEGFGVELNKRGRVVAQEETQKTSEKGVFAGGDLVTGPASVIEAIQGGRLAAISIDKYLDGDGEIEQKLYPDDEADPYIGRDEDFAARKRYEPDKVPVKVTFPCPE